MEYINTSNLVKEIKAIKGQKIYLSDMLGRIVSKIMFIDIINKVFGDLYYDVFEFDDLPLCFHETIKNSEEKS